MLGCSTEESELILKKGAIASPDKTIALLPELYKTVGRHTLQFEDAQKKTYTMDLIVQKKVDSTRFLSKGIILNHHYIAVQNQDIGINTLVHVLASLEDDNTVSESMMIFNPSPGLSNNPFATVFGLFYDKTLKGYKYDSVFGPKEILGRGFTDVYSYNPDATYWHMFNFKYGIISTEDRFRNVYVLKTN
jgi:hypothetical protein